MNKKVIERLFKFNLALQMIGVLGHQFFYWVQENFYGEPNFLKPISDALNAQTSATSFFVVLGMTASGMAFFMLSTENRPFIMGIKKIFWLYALPIIPGSIYTLYEIHQMYNPTYPDNCVLDITLGWLAVIVFWAVYTLVIARTKHVLRFKYW